MTLSAQTTLIPRENNTAFRRDIQLFDMIIDDLQCISSHHVYLYNLEETPYEILFCDYLY